MLESDLPPALMCWGLTRNLGQDLFAPPNVKGWDGGIAWITTNNLLNRYNFAAFLVMGRNALPMIAADKQKARRIQERLNRINRRQTPVDCDKLFTADERSSKGRFLAALQKRFIQSELSSKQARAALREFLESERELTAEVMLDAVRLILCTPEYQLT